MLFLDKFGKVLSRKLAAFAQKHSNNIFEALLQSKAYF